MLWDRVRVCLRGVMFLVMALMFVAGLPQRGAAFQVLLPPEIDSTLSEFSVTNNLGEELAIDPVFTPTTASYTLKVGNDVTSVSVLGIPNNTAATVTPAGFADETGTFLAHRYTLDVGDNDIIYKVTSQNKTQVSTYSIKVTRAAPPPTLTLLSLSDGTLSPSFAGDVSSYTATVPYDVSAITVSAATADAAATIKVNDTAVVDGKSDVDLIVGDNTISVTVSNADTGTSTYTVTVTREAASTDATLSSLSLTGVQISPDFSAGITSYTATVAYDVLQVSLKATANDAKAKMSLLGQPLANDTGADLLLSIGPNTVAVVVTAEDSSTKTYTITVTREAASTDSLLSGLAVSDVTLSPAFDSDTSDYTAQAPYSLDGLTVTPTLSSATATVTVNGTATESGSGVAVDLNVGENTIDVVVTAEDGTSVTTYQVVVTRARLNSAPVAQPGVRVTSPVFSPGDLVTLTGENSFDADKGDELTYSWKQTAGPDVTINNADAKEATFTAPLLEAGQTTLDLTFELTVSDGALSDSASITVTIGERLIDDRTEAVAKVVGKTPENGVYTVTSGETVTLTGEDSTGFGKGEIGYEWTTESSDVVLDPTDQVTTSFVAPDVDEPTDIEITLTVTGSDGDDRDRLSSATIAPPPVLPGLRQSVTVQITVVPAQNIAPFAKASYTGGEQGQLVTLSGEGSSDENGDELTYSWEQIDEGPLVVLDTPRGREATFVAPVLAAEDEPITLTFELTVSDGDLTDSTTVEVVIYYGKVVMQPVAVAKVVGKTPEDGVYTLTSGETVTLSGEDSEGVDPDIITYLWTTDSVGVSLSSADEATTSFVAPEVTAPTAISVTLTIGMAPDDVRRTVAQSVARTDTVVVNMTVVPPDVIGPGTDAEIEAARLRVQRFMQQRNALVLSNQPELDDMLNPGASDGSANLTVSSMGGQADIATAFDKPVWLRLKGSWSTVDGAEGDYLLGSVGAHLVERDGFVLGVMAQADHMKTVDGLSVAEGTGLMAGPYAVARLKTLPLTVQGRLLYGTTDNSLSPLGTFEDSFAGKRVLAQLGVSGQVLRGTVTWKPTLSAGYVRETSEAYVDGAGTPVAAQESAMAQVAPGLELSFPVAVSTGSLQLSFGVADVWTTTLAGPSASYDGHRGRIRAGLNRMFSDETSLSAMVEYDGIGTPDYEALSVDLRLNHRF